MLERKLVVLLFKCLNLLIIGLYCWSFCMNVRIIFTIFSNA